MGNDVGACVRESRLNGESCKTTSGQVGRCRDARCVAVGGLPEETCHGYDDEILGAYRRCTRGLAFSLSPEKLAEVEKKVERELTQSYRYDMKVSLVELADGGYNIVALNRRSTSDLRGLVDPSFVAWAVADFTQKTDWKSRNLHIWMKPYEEGWGLSTVGSRDAVRHGRARSGLGWLGVLNAPAFRNWLEKAFRPLGPEGMRVSTQRNPIAGSLGRAAAAGSASEGPVPSKAQGERRKSRGRLAALRGDDTSEAGSE